METSNQLALLDFGEHQIQIHGTQDEPLIKCSDLIVHVLGYRDNMQASWFKTIKNDPYYVTTSNHSNRQFFTEQGIYKAIMKSNKPIAELFQKQVCELLKKIRKTTILQLEDAKREIEELKTPKVASIYKITHNDKLLYVGKDCSKLQNRFQQHLQ